MNVPALRRGDNPSKATGSLAAQPLGLDGVESERSDMSMWFNQSKRQVGDGMSLESGGELVWQEFRPGHAG
jgi:hypothetical protein